jgi:hypothetical protein
VTDLDAALAHVARLQAEADALAADLRHRHALICAVGDRLAAELRAIAARVPEGATGVELLAALTAAADALARETDMMTAQLVPLGGMH